MGPAAMRTICCRWAASSRRARRCSRRAARRSNAAWRGSSAACRRASRAAELANFIAEARAAYGLAAPIAVGYSNGANIAAAVLLLHPQALGGAVLMRAMAPFRQPATVDLTGKRVLMLSGEGEPMAPAESAERLAATLAGAGAIVERELVPTGHQLSQLDAKLARGWLARI
jgi:phospholipase/carboxylesterase